MNITVIVSIMLIVQVSASFLDVFQGAVHSVQNSFGKLFSDVVTDVKDTVDCTILAVEYVLSLNAEATERYKEKCKAANETSDIEPKHNNVPAVEISFMNNDYLNKAIPAEIDAKINETMIKILNGYNPHDKLAEVERELAIETERLANVSSLVKQELDKLSNEIQIDFGNKERGNYKPNMDIILRRLKLLQAIEKHDKNSSEANEIHKVVENVLHKLDAIEASEVSENSKVDKILKDLENSSNVTYLDLRKRLEHWKEDEDRQIDLIKKQIQEHDKLPVSEYLPKANLDNGVVIPSNDTYINRNLSSSKPYNTLVPPSTNSPIIDLRSTKNILTGSSNIVHGQLRAALDDGNPITNTIMPSNFSSVYVPTNETKETVTKLTTPPLFETKFMYRDLKKRLGPRKKNKDSHSDLVEKQIEEHREIPEQSDALNKTKLDNSLEIHPNDTYINSAQTGSIFLVFTKQPGSYNNDTIHNGTNVITTMKNTRLTVPSNTVTNITNSQVTTSTNAASTNAVPLNTTIETSFNLTMPTLNNISTTLEASNNGSNDLTTTVSIVKGFRVLVPGQLQARSLDIDKPITSTMKHTMLSNMSALYITTNVTEKTSMKLITPALSETTIIHKQLKKRLEFWRKNKDGQSDFKKPIEILENMPKQSVYLQKITLKNEEKKSPNDTYTSSTQKLAADSHNVTEYITNVNSRPLTIPSKSVHNLTMTPINPNLASSDIVPESTTAKNSFNLTISTLYNSLVPTTSYTPAINLRTTEKILTDSNVSERLQGRSPDENKLRSVAMKYTELPNLLSLDVAANEKKELTTKLTTLALSATKFTSFESNTIPNYSDNKLNTTTTTTTTSRTTTERDVSSTIEDNKKLTIINTAIYQQPSTSIVQTSDVTKMITPVATTRDSYVNETKYTTVSTDTLSTVDSATTINLNTNATDKDSDYIDSDKISTTTPGTTEQEVIVDSTTTSIPITTLKILLDNPTTKQRHSKNPKKKRKSRYHAISTQATDDKYNTHAKSVSAVSETAEKPPNIANKFAGSTPSLKAFLNYIDRLVTTTPMGTRSILKNKEVSAEPIIPVTTQIHEPWVAQSRHIASGTPPYIPHNKHIPSYNANNPTMPMFKGVHPLPGFPSPKTLFNTDSVYTNNIAIPPTYPRNRHSLMSMTPRTRPLLPSKAYGTPLPYVKNYPTLDKPNQWNPKRPLIQPLTNGYRPPVFNRRPISSDRFTPSNKKTDNFDDPDYDSFFHLPSKDAKVHNQALEEAQTLIKESQRTNRLMHDILNRKNKGISAFSLQNSLKFG